MKKIMAVLLAMVLALCSFSFALADDPDEIPGTVEIPYAGLTFVPPEAYRNAVGQIVYNGYDQLGASSYYAAWYYCAMTEDELNAIYAGEMWICMNPPLNHSWMSSKKSIGRINRSGLFYFCHPECSKGSPPQLTTSN